MITHLWIKSYILKLHEMRDTVANLINNLQPLFVVEEMYLNEIQLLWNSKVLNYKHRELLRLTTQRLLPFLKGKIVPGFEILTASFHQLLSCLVQMWSFEAEVQVDRCELQLQLPRPRMSGALPALPCIVQDRQSERPGQIPGQLLKKYCSGKLTRVWLTSDIWNHYYAKYSFITTESNRRI